MFVRVCVCLCAFVCVCAVVYVCVYTMQHVVLSGRIHSSFEERANLGPITYIHERVQVCTTVYMNICINTYTSVHMYAYTYI